MTEKSMKPVVKAFDPATEYFFEEGCHIVEVSNSADDPEVSIARARVEPGVTTKWHCLHGVTERYVILQGKGNVQVGGRVEQEVQQGDVVIIPSGESQCITNVGSDDLVFLAICSPPFIKQAYEEL